MHPSVWGKYFWNTIHLAALGYPDNPTFEDKTAYKEFYASIGKVLPCVKCKANYARHFAELPIDPYLTGGKRKLFEWTVYFHNTVNKELGKPQWNVSFAWEHYKKMVENSKKAMGKTDGADAAMKWGWIALIIVNIVVIMLILRKGI
jgi:hypothetical protein